MNIKYFEKQFANLDPHSLEQLQQHQENPSKTKHYNFDKRGYIECRNFVDPELFHKDIIIDKGIMFFEGNKIVDEREENQVPGSFALHSRPEHKFLHTLVRQKIEKLIGCKLYNTYYYERFYYPGQDLFPHVDRSNCQISASINVRTNLPDPYEFCVLSEDKPVSFILNPGDAVIYKGCEVMHWRPPMPGKKRNFFRKLIGQPYFYHQIFFHYVLANGHYAHMAGCG